jgi:hypothetical protein
MHASTDNLAAARMHVRYSAADAAPRFTPLLLDGDRLRLQKRLRKADEYAMILHSATSLPECGMDRGEVRSARRAVAAMRLQVWADLPALLVSVLGSVAGARPGDRLESFALQLVDAKENMTAAQHLSYLDLVHDSVARNPAIAQEARSSIAAAASAKTLRPPPTPTLSCTSAAFVASVAVMAGAPARLVTYDAAAAFYSSDTCDTDGPRFVSEQRAAQDRDEGPIAN